MTAIMSTSRPFRAIYPFQCAACKGNGDEGDWACYDASAICHIDCARNTIGGRSLLREGIPYRALTGTTERPDEEPTYIVRGARKPTRCGECHLEHSGDCW